MKEIFQSKVFGVILVILLLTLFLYPPFIAKVPTGGYSQTGGEVVINRSWGWIFSSPRYSGLIMELDFKTIVAESIIAILVTIGVCLIPFKSIVLMFKRVFTSRYLKLALVILMTLLPVLWIISKYLESQRLKETKTKELKQGREEKSLERMIEELRQITKQEQKTEGWITIPKKKESDQE